MSIVGTRPPLVSETNLYEPHHKVRKLRIWFPGAIYHLMERGIRRLATR